MRRHWSHWSEFMKHGLESLITYASFRLSRTVWSSRERTSCISLAKWQKYTWIFWNGTVNLSIHWDFETLTSCSSTIGVVPSVSAETILVFGGSVCSMNNYTSLCQKISLAASAYQDQLEIHSFSQERQGYLRSIYGRVSTQIFIINRDFSEVWRVCTRSTHIYGDRNAIRLLQLKMAKEHTAVRGTSYSTLHEIPTRYLGCWMESKTKCAITVNDNGWSERSAQVGSILSAVR